MAQIEGRINRYVKENLVEGMNYKIISEEERYTWEGRLSNHQWVGNEYEYFESREDAAADAVGYLTRTYKELAFAPAGIPVEHRDFSVYQDDPYYASWRSCGDTFGDNHAGYLCLDGGVASPSKSARDSLRFIFLSEHYLQQPTASFEKDKIVLELRAMASNHIKAAWVKQNLMPIELKRLWEKHSPVKDITLVSNGQFSENQMEVDEAFVRKAMSNGCGDGEIIRTINWFSQNADYEGLSYAENILLHIKFVGGESNRQQERATIALSDTITTSV